MTARTRQAFVALVVAAVAASVLGGLFLLGSPRKERERRLDDRRIADLRALAGAVDLYWTRAGRLPPSLGGLLREQGIEVNTMDPESNRPYDYRVLGDKGYELCAEFSQGTSDEGAVARGDFWSHGPGSQCFRLEPKVVKR